MRGYLDKVHSRVPCAPDSPENRARDLAEWNERCRQ